MRRRWLVKSEPEAFGWADLLGAPGRTTCWDGVRNYQARNMLRDELAVDDEVLFYQSCTVPLGVVGTMRVVRAGYPDPTQFDPRHPGFDPRSFADAPRWFAVDVRHQQSFGRVVTLAELRDEPLLTQLPLLRKGNRLSVQPVPMAAFRRIVGMGTQSERGPTPR